MPIGFSLYLVVESLCFPLSLDRGKVLHKANVGPGLNTQQGECWTRTRTLLFWLRISLWLSWDFWFLLKTMHSQHPFEFRYLIFLFGSNLSEPSRFALEISNDLLVLLLPLLIGNWVCRQREWAWQTRVRVVAMGALISAFVV